MIQSSRDAAKRARIRCEAYQTQLAVNQKNAARSGWSARKTNKITKSQLAEVFAPLAEHVEMEILQLQTGIYVNEGTILLSTSSGT